MQSGFLLPFRHPPVLRILRFLFASLAVAAIAVLASCSSAESPLELPESVAGWSRSSQAPIAANTMPESLRRLDARSGVQATYQQGAAKVPASVYLLPSATSAFEAVQTYARQADEYYFHKGSSFVVVNLKELPMDSRRNFLLAFQTATTPDGPEKSKE
jgi:hypothetical protein